MHPASQHEAHWEARGEIDFSIGRCGVGQAVWRQAALLTVNMLFMLVTLETSQASCWLKSFAYCRARRGAVGSGMRDKPSVAGVASGQAVWRQAALHTLNIPSMVVTLETFQASGWLKTRAPCREKRGAMESRRRDRL